MVEGDEPNGGALPGVDLMEAYGNFVLNVKVLGSEGA